MQIEKHEYIAVTTGLTAQVGIMTRLAKERRVTIESLKHELQLRDQQVEWVKSQMKTAVDTLSVALAETEQTVGRIVNILNGDDKQPPTEDERGAIHIAWDAQQRLASKAKRCKGRACCK